MKPSCMTILVILFALSATPAPADDTLRISTSYKTLLSTPDQSGMLDKIVKEAFRRIGMNATIVFTPTERSLEEVNAGFMDGEINRIEGMEKSFHNLVRVPEPNMQMQFVAFATRYIPVSDWESIRHLDVGIVKGWKILERNTLGFPHVTRTVDPETLFHMLHKDRLDIVLYAKLTGCEKIREMGYENIHHLDPPLASKDMFLYLHKKYTDLASPLADALKEMKQDGTYTAMVSETTERLHSSHTVRVR